MKNFKDFIAEAKDPLTKAAREEGFDDVQDALNKKNIYFNYDYRNEGGTVPSSVKSILKNKIVGSFDWDTSRSTKIAMLSEPFSISKGDLSKIKLKNGEKIFQYATPTTAAGGMAPLVKINYLKGKAYFLTEESMAGETDDTPEFESRGVKLKLLRLDEKYLKELNIL